MKIFRFSRSSFIAMALAYLIMIPLCSYAINSNYLAYDYDTDVASTETAVEQIKVKKTTIIDDDVDIGIRTYLFARAGEKILIPKSFDIKNSHFTKKIGSMKFALGTVFSVGIGTSVNTPCIPPAAFSVEFVHYHSDSFDSYWYPDIHTRHTFTVKHYRLQFHFLIDIYSGLIIGPTLGFSRNKAKAHQKDPGDPDAGVYFGGKVTKAFCYGFTAGVQKNCICDTVSIELLYRFNELGVAKTKKYFKQPTPEAYYSAKLSSQELMFGLKFAF